MPTPRIFAKDKLSCHRWSADIHALQQASALLLDRIRAELHRPAGITLASDFGESA